MEIDNRYPEIRRQRRPTPPQRPQIQPQRYKQPQRIDPAKYQQPAQPEPPDPAKYQNSALKSNTAAVLRNKFSGLKYRNILSLIIGAIAIGWIVTLPLDCAALRNRQLSQLKK
ncbi:MAG: hypothetical protein HC894_01155 [Microcoleus sp. SM1_3_4]|nr:hypothetical protein [Microcoleus sp. SM1_3_4]